jgi:hypothetical protein
MTASILCTRCGAMWFFFYVVAAAGPLRFFGGFLLSSFGIKENRRCLVVVFVFSRSSSANGSFFFIYSPNVCVCVCIRHTHYISKMGEVRDLVGTGCGEFGREGGREVGRAG